MVQGITGMIRGSTTIIATVTTTGTIGGVTATGNATGLAKAHDPYNFPAANSSYVGTLAAA